MSFQIMNRKIKQEYTGHIMLSSQQHAALPLQTNDLYVILPPTTKLH